MKRHELRLGSVCLLGAVWMSAPLAGAAATPAAPAAGLPLPLRERIEAAQRKGSAAQKSLDAALTGLNQQLTAAKAAMKQFRTAAKQTSGAVLTTSLETAKRAYEAYDGLARATHAHAVAAASAQAELRDILVETDSHARSSTKSAPTTPAARASADAADAKQVDKAARKAAGVASVLEQAKRLAKAQAVADKISADQDEAALTTLEIRAALTAPRATGPGACDIRKIDWLNLKYPDAGQGSIQLKNGHARQDAGTDAQGSPASLVFNLSALEYGDTNGNAAGEAFVVIAALGVGFNVPGYSSVYAFEEDASCSLKHKSGRVVYDALDSARMSGNHFETKDSLGNVTEWRFLDQRLLDNKPGQPPCQGGLSAGVYRKGKLSLTIPASCTAPVAWLDVAGQALAAPEPVGMFKAANGQERAGVRTAEGDVCGQYALSPSATGLTLAWVESQDGTVFNAPGVVAGCKSLAGEYKKSKVGHDARGAAVAVSTGSVVDDQGGHVRLALDVFHADHRRVRRRRSRPSLAERHQRELGHVDRPIELGAVGGVELAALLFGPFAGHRLPQARQDPGLERTCGVVAASPILDRAAAEDASRLVRRDPNPRIDCAVVHEQAVHG